MKKKLLVILCIALLLSGCSKSVQNNTQTNNRTSSSSQSSQNNTNTATSDTTSSSKESSAVNTNIVDTSSNSQYTKNIKFYYPDFLNGRIVYKNIDIQISSKKDMKVVFEKYFKESIGKDITPLLTNNVKINKLSLNTTEKKVYIDLSNNFVSEMNAGSGLESDIIQCITNTLGDYYHVKNVYISLDGKPYSSGHIELLSEDDSFTVDYANTFKYEK